MLHCSYWRVGSPNQVPRVLDETCEWICWQVCRHSLLTQYQNGKESFGRGASDEARLGVGFFIIMTVLEIALIGVTDLSFLFVLIGFHICLDWLPLVFILPLTAGCAGNCLDRSHGSLLPICLDWLPYLPWLTFIGFHFTVDCGMCEACVEAWVGKIQIMLAIGSSWSLWERIRSHRF